MSDAFDDALRALRSANAAGHDALEAEERARRKELAEVAELQRQAHLHACTREISIGEIPNQVATALGNVDYLFLWAKLDSAENESLTTIRTLLQQIAAAAERYVAECADLDTTGYWQMATEGRYRVVYREADGKSFRFQSPRRARTVMSDLAHGRMSFDAARRLEALDKAKAA